MLGWVTTWPLSAHAQQVAPPPAVGLFALTQDDLTAQIEAELQAAGYSLRPSYGPTPSPAVLHQRAQRLRLDAAVEVDPLLAHVRVWTVTQGPQGATLVEVGTDQERVVALRVIEALRAALTRPPPVATPKPKPPLPAKPPPPQPVPPPWRLKAMPGVFWHPRSPHWQPFLELGGGIVAHKRLILWIVADLPLWRHTIPVPQGQLKWTGGRLLGKLDYELASQRSWSLAFGAGFGVAATHIQGVARAAARASEGLVTTPMIRLEGTVRHRLSSGTKVTAHLSAEVLYPPHRAFVLGQVAAQQGPVGMRAGVGMEWEF